nr:vegetative cell wall protein gp1-like [Arachis hypogaea]
MELDKEESQLKEESNKAIHNNIPRQKIVQTDEEVQENIGVLATERMKDPQAPLPPAVPHSLHSLFPSATTTADQPPHTAPATAPPLPNHPLPSLPLLPPSHHPSSTAPHHRTTTAPPHEELPATTTPQPSPASPPSSLLPSISLFHPQPPNRRPSSTKNRRRAPPSAAASPPPPPPYHHLSESNFCSLPIRFHRTPIPFPVI